MHVTITRVRRAKNTLMSSLVVADGFKIIFSCFTIANAEKAISAGTGSLKITRSPRFSKAAGKDVWTPEITGWKGRAGLRIHAANFDWQLEGCEAPGYKFGDLDHDGRVDIADSKKAFADLMAVLERGGLRDSPCPITIRDVKG